MFRSRLVYIGRRVGNGVLAIFEKKILLVFSIIIVRCFASLKEIFCFSNLKII